MEQMTTICDLVGQAIQKKEEEKRIAEEQAAEDRYWKIPICYDDDDDYTIAITPVLPTKEPVNSLSMGDEHLDAIPATESDEVISLREKLVQSQVSRGCEVYDEHSLLRGGRDCYTEVEGIDPNVLLHQRRFTS
ncbi:hypothetical protein Tco_0083883 [Tanacetum coccineum]